MELTDLQKKTLQTFALYCESQNTKKASLTFFISDCNLDGPDYYFYDEDGDSRMDGYPKILNLLNELANKIKDEAIDAMEECENYGELKFLIDCDEKDLTVQVYENVRTSTEDGSSEEIPSNVHFRDLIEYMKKHGYTIGSVYFNGGGDSGYIEDNIDFSGGGSGRAPLDRFGKVEDFLYDMLQNLLPGWEIDSGSSGSFEINLNDNMIYLSIDVYDYEMQLVATLLRTEF